MESLYVVVDNTDTLTLEKVTNELFIVPSFRLTTNGERYIESKICDELQDSYKVLEFSFARFDYAKAWADKSGIDLFIQIRD